MALPRTGARSPEEMPVAAWAVARDRATRSDPESVRSTVRSGARGDTGLTPQLAA
jgi:hypothetical protein